MCLQIEQLQVQCCVTWLLHTVLQSLSAVHGATVLAGIYHDHELLSQAEIIMNDI
jgi:hypothetical protein